MKLFEERYTAWIDGQLDAGELGEFERALPDRAAAELDRAGAHQLSNLLRQHAEAPALSSADFFSHQLLERMAAEDRRAAPAPRRSGWFLSLPTLAWAGFGCMVLSAGLYFSIVAPSARHAGSSLAAGQQSLPVTAVHVAEATPGAPADPELYDASIIESTPREPGVSATTIYSKTDNMAVLWLDGLDYLPASYQLR